MYHTQPKVKNSHTPHEAILTPRESMVILILLICESIGLLSQLFLGKNQLNNDVRKENVHTLNGKHFFRRKMVISAPETPKYVGFWVWKTPIIAR